MKRWQAILLSMSILGLIIAVAWVDDPEDYVAPSTATYFTGVVTMRSMMPNVWAVTNPECGDAVRRPCISFLVEDDRLDFNMVVTLAIGAKEHYRKTANGYVPEHIQVIDYNSNSMGGH